MHRTDSEREWWKTRIRSGRAFGEPQTDFRYSTGTRAGTPTRLCTCYRTEESCNKPEGLSLAQYCFPFVTIDLCLNISALIHFTVRQDEVILPLSKISSILYLDVHLYIKVILLVDFRSLLYHCNMFSWKKRPGRAELHNCVCFLLLSNLRTLSQEVFSLCKINCPNIKALLTWIYYWKTAYFNLP